MEDWLAQTDFGIERRLTVEECYQLIELSEAIFEYGRMIQAFHGRASPYVIVEIPELAVRFRRHHGLLMTRPCCWERWEEPSVFVCGGCWELKLAGTLRSANECAKAA
jgi:hypothetical protein